MTFTFRPGIRENIGLLIGLAGGTGSGKSYSAARLASGIAGDRPFAVVDTEARRFLHYADQFKFDHCELRPPFRPQAYEDAIVAADKAGYPVIVVDSASLVWSGDGGVLDWQEEELVEMVKRAKSRNDSRNEWQIRESGKMASWIKPKMAHKHMVQRLLQVRAHVILCFRAEEKIEMKKGKDGKMEIAPKETTTGFKGWIPICDKNLPFELTCSFLLTADSPGVPKPIKLQEQHRHLFPFGVPITEESGRALAVWAAGGQAQPAAKTTGEKPVYITDEQAIEFDARCSENGINVDALKKAAGVQRLSLIEAKDYDRAKSWIDAAIARRKQAQTASAHD